MCCVRYKFQSGHCLAQNSFIIMQDESKLINHDDSCKRYETNPPYVFRVKFQLILGTGCFTKEVPDILEGKTEPERRSVITICNDIDTIVYVELHPIEMVRRNIARNKDFGFGVEGAGGVTIKVAIVKREP